VPAASQYSRLPPPPLRIHHFMACAVVAAVLLSLLRLRFAWSPSPQQQSLAGNGLLAFTQVLTSIGLTLTGFSIYWWRKGYNSFSQPGQMLLVQYAASLVLSLLTLAFAIAMSQAGSTSRITSWISLLPMALGIGSLVFGVLLPVAFYSWCAWKIADTWPWRVLFVLCAVAAILTSTLMMLLAQFIVRIGPSDIPFIIAVPQLMRGILLGGIGILVVVTDLAAHRNRSWTHWAGVILWLLGQVGSILSGLFYLFFWRVP
jgi:hypothetical protein